MKKNMGAADKMIRLIVAAIITVLYISGAISGTIAVVAGVVALIFVLTSFISFCPLYTILGINTCKIKK